MEIVVAEDSARACFPHEAQHASRVGSTVHKVSYRMKLVRGWIKAQPVEQASELGLTSLDVAEEDPTARSRVAHLRPLRRDRHVGELPMLMDSPEQHSAAPLVAESHER